MGRITREIEIDGARFWAMFDTGSKNTYVLPPVAEAAAFADEPVTGRHAAEVVALLSRGSLPRRTKRRGQAAF